MTSAVPENSRSATKLRLWTDGSWLVPVLLLGIVLLGATIRVRGALNDLWMDEIWSVELARTLASPGDVFIALHNENNHYLNTIWIALIGPTENSLWYRLPAILAGIGATLIAAMLGARRGRPEMLFSAGLTAWSYPLVLYSSEARGYSLAVLCGLAALYLLPRADRERRGLMALFAAVEVIGLLSHLSFVNVVMATFAWSTWNGWRRGWPRRAQLTQCAWLHLVPLLVLGALYAVDLRLLRDGEGTVAPSLIHSFGSALAWTVGTSSERVPLFIACLTALAGLYAGLRRLERDRSGAIVFFVGVIVVFPAGLLVVRNSEIVYVRYFLFSVTFLLILYSYVLGHWFRRGGGWAIASVGLALLHLLLNAQCLGELFRHGRGQYRAALDFIVHTSAPRSGRIVLGSDEDFRTLKPVLYYGPRASAVRPIHYQLNTEVTPDGFDVVILTRESFQPAADLSSEFTDGYGNRYQLLKEFRTAPLSGIHWFVYGKLPRS